jgi:sialate O-acetylesterase
MHRFIRLVSLTALAVSATLAVQAEVKLPAIFGDHMVLQQDISLPVWGWATPGEKVTVEIAGRRGETTASADGKWRVTLKPVAQGSQPFELKVSGTNTVVFTDVLVGDVWVCSGQSNMEFGLGLAHNTAQAVPQANHPQIRLFRVNPAVALSPQEDCTGTWMVCTPENVIKIGGWNGFSAVAYFFGREIQQARNVPIGLIGTYWGGTPAQAWTSLEALRAKPALEHYAKAADDNQTHLAENKARYESEILPKWKEAVEAWKLKPEPKGREPWRPAPPDRNPSLSTGLFNAMISPLTGYGIKGAIWYQGEANAGSDKAAKEYAELFPAMITDWRARWGQGDFPFLFVQLANFSTGGAWPKLRDAQTSTLSLPNTGMAVAIDVGEAKDIHPKNKEAVGHRLALAARHVAYREKIVYSGPLYRSMKVKGAKIEVRFSQTGGGLMIGAAPALRVDEPAASPADRLNAFEIAGVDKKFVPAQASIEKDRVVVWSDQVNAPVAVRYAWSAFPEPAANLYNREGLPASPFSTSDE